MAAFSFSFAGDDIEDVSSDMDVDETDSSLVVQAADPVMHVPVRKENAKELLSTLPSQISYTTTLITSPHHSRQALIPRRALFDARMQLMAESPSLSSNTEIGLGNSDIESNVYEGGFKIWEGAMDLARLLLDRGPRKELDEMVRVDGVVELGCGTALPSLVLFQYALLNGLQIYFTLVDYNAAVLRLVTLPNLLLVWAMQHHAHSFSPHPPALRRDGAVENPEGELEITPELVDAFENSLMQSGITLALLSGPWSPQLVSLAPLHPSMSLLVLAAETIYSPVSLGPFCDVLYHILRVVREGKAFVAAKKMYFGVGGGVDEFRDKISRAGAVCTEVKGSGVEGCDETLDVRGGGGVGRLILEVQMC